MTEKEALDAGGSIGLKLSWDGKEKLETDENFWKTYFSDIRYSYYFYNLDFKKTSKDITEPVLLYASLNGDSIAADHVLYYASYFFEKYQTEFESFNDLRKAIIDSQDDNTRFFLRYKYSYIFDNNFNEAELLSAIDTSQLSHRYKVEYYNDISLNAYSNGSIDYYRIRDESIKLIQNSSSKILSFYEVALVINLMYQSMNLDNYKISSQISSILEDRLELNVEEKSREASIYDRYIKNIYFKSEFNNMDLVLTWVLNLTSTLDSLYPDNLKALMERRTFMLEFVENAHENGYISDIHLSNWLSDTASNMIQFGSACSLAESYFNKAFEVYDKNEISTDDPFQEPLALSRCFIDENNIIKANSYIERARDNVDLSKYEKYFHKSFINLNQVRIYLLEEKFKLAYDVFKQTSKNLFENIDRLSSTLDPDHISKYVNDYIEIFNKLNELNFDMTNIRNNFELEELRSRAFLNKRLDQIKIDSNKKNIEKLKNELNDNRLQINKYEQLIATNFEDSFIKEVEGLYKRRSKIMKDMLSKNKNLNELFQPSYNNYLNLLKNLDSQSAVISYNLSSDGGYIILNTSSNTKYFKIQEGSSYIQSKINELRESMENYDNEFSFLSASILYEILFKPIEIYLNEVNNIYIYGSSLEDLSFGTLVKNYDDLKIIENESKKLLVADWLIKNYSFARIYPLNNNEIHSKFDYKYLGFANPDSFGEIGLSELPNAEDEILQIGLSSQSYSREFLLTKSNASKKNLKEKLANSYERIVFATHAVPPFWKGITSEGALVLDDENGDYFLTSTEVVNLDFQSDMVVLSSCSTEEKGSDSIYKSFLVAGANSVLYTNWELETVSASLITDRIFKYILFEEYPKHKALQLSSIDMMSDYSNPLYAHPAFWGNFSIAYRSL